MVNQQVDSTVGKPTASGESGKLPIKTKRQSIKCVVWDLDNTLWDGVLLEDGQISLRTDVVDVIKTLDSRGILEQLGLNAYFLYPQINWNSKAASIREIVRSINIGIDALAFIDDQAFEREEVAFSLPEVLCIDTTDVPGLLDMPEMNPRFITEDSQQRRLMYLSDIARNKAEQEFVGPSEEFLATLQMAFTIAPAKEEDLRRAEELTLRTHQLNTTGYTYSYEELNEFRQSDTHKLFIASLDDRHGTYGKIGLALVECLADVWTIKLLLMSCRVMSRGVGTIMIHHIMNLAKKAGVPLRAEFVANDRNRMMYITYKFGGFKEVEKVDNLIVFENDLSYIQPFPDYIKVHFE